jgi:hypothetical protein
MKPLFNNSNTNKKHGNSRHNSTDRKESIQYALAPLINNHQTPHTPSQYQASTILSPEDLTPQEKLEYEEMIRNVEMFWIEKDKHDYPSLFDGVRKSNFSVNGKEFEIETIPGREYLLGPNNEELQIPPEIQRQLSARGLGMKQQQQSQIKQLPPLPLPRNSKYTQGSATKENIPIQMIYPQPSSDLKMSYA